MAKAVEQVSKAKSERFLAIDQEMASEPAATLAKYRGAVVAHQEDLEHAAWEFWLALLSGLQLDRE